MKVVISQCKGCYENNQILTDYPILQKYVNKGHYVRYTEDYSDYNDDEYYWKENSIIVELTNDEVFKLMQELTSYKELIIGYTDKYDHKNYGIDFFVKIYDDYNE